MRREITRTTVLWTGWMPAVILGVQLAAASPQPQNGTVSQGSSDDAAPRVARLSRENLDAWLGVLVERLGAPKFELRQEAARDLRDCGLAAREHLVAALSHPDAEVRAGARVCLNEILDAERDRRFAIAQDDPSRLDEMDLPGWKRFRAMIGADDASRALFLELFAEEPQLLESAASGGPVAVQSLIARCRQLQAFQQLPIDQSDRQAGFASVAALIFVGADPSADLPPEVLTEVMSHLNKSAFQNRLQDDDRGSVRRLLAAWIHQTGDSLITYQNLLLAARCDVLEAIPVAKSLAENRLASPENRMYGILLVGKVGSLNDARWMTQFLEDDAVCSAYAYLREGSRGKYETQIRDVALATLLHLTEQDHLEYGFRRLRGHSQMLFNTSSIGFAVGEPERMEALNRWREWEKKNPLPKDALQAPPGTISVYGQPATQASEVDTEHLVENEDDVRIRVAQAGGGVPIAGREADLNGDDNPPAPVVAPGVPPGADVDDFSPRPLGNLPPFYLKDRQVRVWLSRAEEAIADGQFVDAAQLIDAALNSPLANSYQPDRMMPIHVGIRAVAEELLSKMPEAGLRAYELHVGFSAKRQLQAAVASRNPLAVADVARRYFYTRTGAEAEMLWGVHLYDAERPMAAAAAFARVKAHPIGKELEPGISFRLAAALTQAGFADEAIGVIATVPSALRPTSFVIGNQHFVPADKNQIDAGAFVKWLATATGGTGPQWNSGDWTVFGGNLARNRFANGERPLLRARWVVETVARPEVQDALNELSSAYAEQRRAAVPGAHPIAVDGHIMVRTPTGLLAVDTSDGTSTWRVEFDAALERRLVSELKDGQKHLLYQELDERLWGDAASGRLSSDGIRVFAIDNSGQVGDALSQRMTISPGGQRRLEPRWRRDQNRLVAFDLATEGKIAWALGGPEGDYELPLAGVYFLGPPLPLGGLLHVLVERQQLVQLLSLDAASGNVLHTLTLASLDEEDSQFSGSANAAVKAATRHAQRRCGSMPAYHAGVLVCPTSDGGFAGVDLTQNEVIWTYRATPRYLREVFKAWQAANEEANPIDPDAPRLLDGEVLIAGDSVLIAPLEVSALLCLDLRTGAVRWEVPLGDLRYVATSAGGVVLLIGRSDIRGIDLASGQTRWPARTLPAGSAPSGRGFASGVSYFLPLSTGELAVVEISSGKITSRLKSHDGRAPGNLICVQDYVVSQCVDRLEVFEQLTFALSQARQELERDGPTAKALMRYGEVLMYSGDYAAACEQLQAAFELEPDERTLQLLCEAVLEAMELDYAKFAPIADAMLRDNSAALDADRRREFIRRQAEHAREAGQYVQAFEATAQLIKLATESDALAPRRPTLDTSELAWLRGQVKLLRQVTPFPEAAEINGLIVDLYDQLPDKPEALARFASLFPDHPLADTCYLRLLDEFSLSDPLEMQFALLNLTHSRRDDIRRDALMRHFDLLVDRSQLAEAAALILAVENQCEDAAELAGLEKLIGARLLDNSLWKPSDSLMPRWPAAAVREEASEQRASYGRRYLLELEEARDAFRDDLQLEIRSDAQSIVARNVYGLKRWEADLRGESGESLLPMNAEAVRTRQVGHVLIVWRGHEVLALDLMTPPGEEARILWRKSLVVSFPGKPAESSVVVRAAAQPGGLPRLTAFDRCGVPLAQLGPANRKYVAYQRGHALEAVDTLSGAVLWRRHDVAPGSKLLGDEDYLIYMEPDCGLAVVLQAEDGRELGRVPTPTSDNWVATVGRRIVSWQEENPARLTIIDPAETQMRMRAKLEGESIVYEREFADGARVCRIGWEFVAVCDPTGNFTILRCEDGDVLVDIKLEPQPKMNALYVVRSQGRFLAMVSEPTETQDTVFAVPGGLQCPVVHGTLFGFDDRNGQLLWQTPVANQSLDLSQPDYLPILTFACRVLPPADEPNQARRYSSRVLCIDKRSGEVLVDEVADGSINRVELVPDFDEKTIEVRTTQDAYRLRFFGELLPDPLEIGARLRLPFEGVLVAPPVSRR